MGVAMAQVPFRVAAEVWRAGWAALLSAGPGGDGD
jgi:hypothetical protein